MYGQGLDYLPRYNTSSPLAQKKSPGKYNPNQPVYFQPYTINKNQSYQPSNQWSQADFHNLRRVSDDVGQLRQTFDVKSHSKINQILSKYDYDNEQSMKPPYKLDRNLRNTFSSRPQYIENYKDNPVEVTNNTYPKPNFLTQSENKNNKSIKGVQKIQVEYNKYKQQLEELQTTKKMAEQLRKLKEDRRKRLQAGSSKQGSTNLNNEVRDISDFKKKKTQEFYSPKYEKVDIVENIELSKTVPLKGKVNLDKYKTHIQQKLTNNIQALKEVESPKLKSFQSLQNNNQAYLTPKLNKQISDFNNTQSPKVPLKSSRKVSANLASVTIDDFQMGKTLGQGRFGTVHQVIHKPTGAIFALKKIPKQNIRKLNMINQLTLELKLQTFLNHQNIVSLYHHFDDSNYIYLLLQYMSEGTLFSQLKKKRTLTQKQVARKIQQIASAIKYLHQNQIAHRDIKPQNIVISNGVCKICDFGWATICNDRRRTCCGTFDYTPPQIFQGEQYDYTVDLWCLGILTYELLVGKAPFYHIRREQTKSRIINVEKTVINYPEHLTKKAVNFIESLLKKDPKQRLSSENLLNHPFLQKLEDEQ